MMEGSHQVIGSCFTCAVRVVWFVTVVFGKGRFVGFKSAVYLVGGDMQETETGLFRLCQFTPVIQDVIQQSVDTNDVGPDKILRTVNGAIDM